MLVLVTGATGKAGQAFLKRFTSEVRWSDARIRALCHNRDLPPHPRIESIKGSIADRETVEQAMESATHVFHMATVKEDPQTAMDVSVKGLFWLLETFRTSNTASQFVLISGDCTVGHIFVPYEGPISEESPRRAYPGVYALSKVLEETMLEQYFVQYDINGCCLRAPWIMEKDDFKYVLSFGPDQFGGPPWSTLISEHEQRRFAADGDVPVLVAGDWHPLKRNFVHVSDLVEAMLAVIDNPAARQQVFNIAMTEPIDYEAVGRYLQETRGLQPAPIATDFYSNRLDNSKARRVLGWQPQYDFHRLIEEAYSYQREESDQRKVWYVG